MIRETAEGTALGLYVVGLLVIVVLAVGAAFAYTQGWFISRENQNIRHSIGYSQAANERCHADIQQYLDAKQTNDTAHMQADYADCKSATSGVPSDALDSDVAQFVAAGGQ